MSTTKRDFGNWYKCVGCGQPIGFFPNGLAPYYPPGSAGHAKPMELIGVPNSVPCDLYNRHNVAELIEIHRNAEKMPAPSEMFPMVEGSRLDN